MATPKVLFVVSNNPFSKDRRTVLKLLEELVKKEAQIKVFLHGNGVWWLSSETLKNLAEKGVEVYCGKDSAAKRNQTIPHWVRNSTLSDLVSLIEEADKVLFFN